MKKISLLENEYVAVLPEGTKHFSYGGNQDWITHHPVIQKNGCGLIAAADVLLYLTKQSREKPGGVRISGEKYRQYVEGLFFHPFPVFPRLGLSGIFLMEGMNAEFRRRKLPFRAFWGVRPSRMKGEIIRMLAEDLPVIFSFGPSLIGRRGSLRLFTPGERTFRNVQNHYVVATGIRILKNAGGQDTCTLTVSSWGRKYEVDLAEWLRYIRKYSNPLFSNLLSIRRISGNTDKKLSKETIVKNYSRS